MIQDDDSASSGGLLETKVPSSESAASAAPGCLFDNPDPYTNKTLVAGEHKNVRYYDWLEYKLYVEQNLKKIYYRQSMYRHKDHHYLWSMDYPGSLKEWEEVESIDAIDIIEDVYYHINSYGHRVERWDRTEQKLQFCGDTAVSRESIREMMESSYGKFRGYAYVLFKQVLVFYLSRDDQIAGQVDLIDRNKVAKWQILPDATEDIIDWMFDSITGSGKKPPPWRKI